LFRINLRMSCYIKNKFTRKNKDHTDIDYLIPFSLLFHLNSPNPQTPNAYSLQFIPCSQSSLDSLVLHFYSMETYFAAYHSLCRLLLDSKQYGMLPLQCPQSFLQSNRIVLR